MLFKWSINAYLSIIVANYVVANNVNFSRATVSDNEEKHSNTYVM